jgi:hypothetical protein
MKGGLVELPSGSPAHGNYRAVLRAADHGKPLVTAVSGFGSPVLRRIEEDTQQAPIPDALFDVLEQVPVSYLLVRDSWLDLEDRPRYREWLARGLASGRLVFVKRFDAALRNDLFTVARVEPGTRPLGPLPWHPVPPSPGAAHEDASLTASVEEPAEGARVSGVLRVRGWARIAGDDLSVTVLIDGETRPPLGALRGPRPDVAGAVPSLGSCVGAGWEQSFAFEEGDATEHEIVAVFRSADGRERHYPARRFVWKP